jgi:hypothetical protein
MHDVWTDFESLRREGFYDPDNSADQPPEFAKKDNAPTQMIPFTTQPKILQFPLRAATKQR